MRGVVGAEVLVLLHLLLQRQRLALQLAAQPRQRVTDVVGQLLEDDKRREPWRRAGSAASAAAAANGISIDAMHVCSDRF